MFLTKFLYEIANVSFYFIMYTDILHLIRILSISQFCLRELLRSLFFFLLSTFIVVIYFLMLTVTITIILLLMQVNNEVELFLQLME